ncbi:hypothetical protein GCM10010371_70030 [Streptomyces subrutilus]|uniref:Uncharacterized protein n=1 Tax=Streptomyces subrutilus TaxID=36818 RepID=A0A918RKB8_9ACTN|nr:hypothetical protein GCM10010371_70030 [Streptomyces subrutilus]
MLALEPDIGPQAARVLLQSGPSGLVPQDPGQATEHAVQFRTRSPGPTPPETIV